MNNQNADGNTGTTRRGFVKGATTAGIAAALAGSGIASRAYAQTSSEIKVGLIGCGGRGTGAAQNAVVASDGIKIWARGDLMPDRLRGSLRSLQANDRIRQHIDVPADRQFTGFDAYEKVIATDVDLVILATPPYFRPQMLKAAVDAGKHVFFEKPAAVDPHGIRIVLEAGKVAEAKGLSLVTGTQRRHHKPYVEAMKAIHDGAIGEVITAYVYWQQGSLWNKGRQPEWTDMEWQLRNWLYFTWLSGDHIVEQHVHNIDVALWAFQDQPAVKAYGNGGRQQRTSEEYGHVNDHFSLEIQMPREKKITSFCRQITGCDNWVGEQIYGTKGHARLGDRSVLMDYDRNVIGQYRGDRNPYEQEHADLVAAIRAGEPVNEAERIAWTTLTAISAREAAYSGDNVFLQFMMNESKLKLGPEKVEFGPIETPPVYIPGEYQVVWADSIPKRNTG